MDAQIVNTVDSVLNPSGGIIRADKIGKLILEKDKVDPGKTTIICTEDQLISFNRSLFFYRGIFLYFGSSIVNLFSNKFKNYVKCGHSAANK